MAFRSIFNWGQAVLMKKAIFLIATFLGGVSVILGSFGAHLFDDYLILIERVDTFETALKYQFYHVFFLFILGLSYDLFNEKFIKYAFYFCLIGMMLFSGSLYLLCLTNNSVFGMITPLGGLSLIFGWFCLFLAIKK